MKKRATGSFLIFCMCVLGGCFDQSQESIDYKKAEAEFQEGRGDRLKFKNAAVIFETLGEYKDSRQRSAECWFNYGNARRFAGYVSPSLIIRDFIREYCSSFALKGEQHNMYAFLDLEKRLEELGEAEEALMRGRDHNDPAADVRFIAKERQTLQIWMEARKALENEEYAKAIQSLEALLPYEKDGTQNLLSLAKNRQERALMTEQFQKYLAGVPKSVFKPFPEKSLSANLHLLFTTDPLFTNNREMITDALAKMCCYKVIATGLNDLLGVGSRKLQDGGMNIQITLDHDTLLLALIQLAEAGDDSAEFNGLLGQLRAVVTSQHSKKFEDPLRRYARALELYNAGPEWVDRCFPDDAELKNYKTPGTIEYRVTHAPQNIRGALYNDMDFLENRFVRMYTTQEAKALFANFVPSKPLDTGFLYIADKGSLPKKARFPDYLYVYYQSPSRTVTVEYSPEFARAGRSDVPLNPGSGGEQKNSRPVLGREAVEQKGQYFCVSNPNNARIAIYEKYRFQHYGKYTVRGLNDEVDVYLPTIDIRVVDLITGKKLFTDQIRADAVGVYQVPNSTKQGDVYIPFNFFDRRSYLAEKLDGLLK